MIELYWIIVVISLVVIVWAVLSEWRMDCNLSINYDNVVTFGAKDKDQLGVGNGNGKTRRQYRDKSARVNADWTADIGADYL